MKKRPFLWAFILAILVPSAALALTSQRAQIAVAIVVNVTPNPLGYVHSRGGSGSGVITVRARLHDASPAMERAFEAQQLHFVPVSDAQSMVIAQSTKQKAVEVEAEVTPNPTATLLTSNVPQVTLNAEAGVNTLFTCAYMVKVDTTVSNWQLKDGLFTDFSSGTSSWSGTDLYHSTYVSAPIPAESPFVVYSDNGGSWHIINGAYYSGVQNFCVDLTLEIPIATPQGTYSSNAIYTLYY
jgi:hypothetical protein